MGRGTFWYILYVREGKQIKSIIIYIYIHIIIYIIIYIIICFSSIIFENTKTSQSPTSQSPKSCFSMSLIAHLFFCIFSPKNTPQKWLFFGYFLDSLAYFLYLCIVNTKEKRCAPVSEKNFPSARGNSTARSTLEPRIWQQ